MATVKEWLVSQGHNVNPKQRGRLPRDLQTIVNAAKAGGMVFDTAVPAKKSPTALASPSVPPKPNQVFPNGVSRTVAPKPATAGKKEVIEPAAQVWPDGTKVFAIINGKQVYGNIKEVERHCGYSLAWCRCQTRTALVGATAHRVYLERP